VADAREKIVQNLQKNQNRISHDVAAGAGPAKPPDFAQLVDGVEMVVPVSVIDRAGAEVVRAESTACSKGHPSGVLERRCNRQRSQPR
jgi:hypothetical protein